MHSLEAKRVRGVVFDLWNTLAYNDHRPNPIVALGDAFGLRGGPGWPKSIERGIMRERLSGIEEGMEALSRLTGKRLARDQVEELGRNWREGCTRTRFFREVPEVLRRLARRFHLGLLSNTQSFDLEFLDRSDLPLSARLFSYELGVLKPHPALFLRMADLLKLAPSELLMVGDNLEDDVTGAEAAGWQALLIRRRNVPLSFQEPHPDRKFIASLEPLPSILLI